MLIQEGAKMRKSNVQIGKWLTIEAGWFRGSDWKLLELVLLEYIEGDGWTLFHLQVAKFSITVLAG